ncbi:MAG: lytic murein transglycosylase B [Pseudomonadota bacterium]
MPLLIKRAALIALLALPPAAGADYSSHPDAEAVANRLAEEAGFEREAVLAILAEAERKERILEAISRPAEKAKPWHEYRKIFLTEEREEAGVAFYAEYRETLERAAAETGVPAEIIVAIIGVETYYGRIMGSYRVLDALSTLAFDYPRRSPFFTSELENYLILTRDQDLDPLAFKGSYAGAMGYGQFMPSSYRNYAVDFDGDGVIDIWNNPVDAIGSVANYFKRHGWRPGEPVVYSAAATAAVDDAIFVRKRADLKPRYTVAELAEKGFASDADVGAEAMATAMEFELAKGYEHWLGLHNFYVITRYNHSAMYAMSVYQLSLRIAAAVAEQGA